MCKIEYAWPSRALSHDDIKLSAAAFRPGRLFRLSRHRDPAPVGVCHTVPVESSLLHCSGIDELSKEGTFCFRPALVNNSGSIRTIRFFRAGVNYFRDVIRRPIRWVSPIWNPPKCDPSSGGSTAPVPPPVRNTRRCRLPLNAATRLSRSRRRFGDAERRHFGEHGQSLEVGQL
jgi:hypothetical protein